MSDEDSSVRSLAEQNSKILLFRSWESHTQCRPGTVGSITVCGGGGVASDVIDQG